MGPDRQQPTSEVSVETLDASMSEVDQVLIAGGGIGGLTAAIALRHAGIAVRVFEQAPELHEVGAGVSLWPNATRALAPLGLLDPVLGDHVPLERIVIHRHDGSRLLRLDEPGRYDEPGICVHRAHLQSTLAAALPADRLELDRRLVDFLVEDGSVTARFHDGSTARGRLLIGCDGIDSTVRARLHGAEPPRDRGYGIWRAVSDFDLPDHLLRQSTEWWGPGRRFGILPGEPGRVYWYATHSAANGAPDASLDRSRVRALFADWPPPVPDLIDATGPDSGVPTAAEDRSVAHGWGSGPVTLLGDAAHPMTPNMGQGACTAIEDAVVLARCVAAVGLTPEALRLYERLRTPRTRWILRQSRRIGRLGQLRSPLLVAARDRLMRLVPAPLADLAQRRVYGYRVEDVGPEIALRPET
jgi:2-polyprenyl-6-methoxyphenol hydroxylase-like FAD-dependent oxidoreductase